MKVRSVSIVAIVIILSVLVILAVSLTPNVRASQWQSDVDPWVLESINAYGKAEFIVFLKEQADLSEAANLKTKDEKGAYVVNELINLATNTQDPIIAELTSLGVEFRPYWVANMIWVRGDFSTVRAMSHQGQPGSDRRLRRFRPPSRAV